MDHCLSQLVEIVTVKLSRVPERVPELALDVGENHPGNFCGKIVLVSTCQICSNPVLLGIE